MSTDNTSRRRFLALGATASTVGLTGCSGGGDDGSNSGGGSGGSVVLDVTDQQGSGQTLTVGTASAPAEFYLDVHSQRETSGTSDVFPAGSTQTDVVIPLAPPLVGGGTLEVGIHNAVNDQHIGPIKEIEYTIVG
jgi:hypothetical protein